MALIISKAGLHSMEQELKRLKKELCELRIFKGSIAINNGDAWHDNNDFEQCEIKERMLLKQISDLSKKISGSTIVDNNNSSLSIVNYGATVSIQLMENGTDSFEEKFLFSDSNEPSEILKISANSPLGNAIYKQEKGYSGSYTVNGNVFNFKILEIEY